MKRVHVIGGLCAVLVLLTVGCTSSRQMRREAERMPIQHQRGPESTCLANCVDMVLDYYGFDRYFAKQPGISTPANLLAMDSLLHAISSPCQADPYRLHSFVVQADEAFLTDQLARQRPVILIFKTGPDLYHSVVAAGITADRRAVYVHDPAKKAGKWMNRGKLLQKWRTTSNTAMLIAIAPAGT